ncbi:MAG: hypothetical protein WA322_01695, partial [Pseudolabrys sp.]
FDLDGGTAAQGPDGTIAGRHRAHRPGYADPGGVGINSFVQETDGGNSARPVPAERRGSPP